MIKLKDIKVISAYDSSKQTGVINPTIAKVISDNARKMAKDGDIVAISMRGISAMSVDASTILCSNLVSDKDIASKILIVGSTPYIDQIVGMGLKKAVVSKSIN